MADSETSTSLSTVTRRMLLAGTSLVLPAWTINPFGKSSSVDGEAPDDALRLWSEWNEANLRTMEFCCRQQDLETRLLTMVGFPHAEIDLPEEELVAHQARWDAADKEAGYSAAMEAEEAAARREQELVETLMATPATSLAGVAGKLDAVLREGESSSDCPEFPWTFIRSALVDLVSIARQIEPDRFVPGTDRLARCAELSSMRESQKGRHNAQERT